MSFHAMNSQGLTDKRERQAGFASSKSKLTKYSVLSVSMALNTAIDIRQGLIGLVRTANFGIVLDLAEKDIKETGHQFI